MREMTENEADEALKPLDSMDKLLAWTFKEFGSDGVLKLFGDDLHGSERIAAHASSLRCMGLKSLADLLDSIAAYMPPQRALVNPDRPGTIDREGEALWRAWLAANPSERALAWDQRWRQARRDWERQHGTSLGDPD